MTMPSIVSPLANRKNIPLQGQACESRAATFNNRSLVINNSRLASPQITVGTSSQTDQDWHKGQLGKDIGVLLRLIQGDINRPDFLRLHKRSLLSFKDILTHIQPATVDTLSDELLKQIVHYYPGDFEAIPEYQLTQDICDKFFQLNKNVFKFIPRRFKTPTMCTQAVESNFKLLGHVPGTRVTEALVELLPCTPQFFRFPPAFLTEIEYSVSEQLRKKLSRCKMMRSIYPLITKAPDKRNYQCYLEACRACWRNLASVPDGLKTREMCLAAIEDNYYALSCIREENRTPELCAAAFNKSVNSLEFIPQLLITEYHRNTLIKACDRKDCDLLPLFNFIPEELRTPDYYQAFAIFCLKYCYFNCLTEFPESFLHIVLPLLLNGLKSTPPLLNEHLAPLLLAACNAPPSEAKRELIDLIKDIMVNRARDVDVTQVDFYSWIKTPGLEKDFKLSLLHLINHPTQPVLLRQETASTLINLGNPLTFTITNSMLKELRSVCRQSILAKMPEQDKGDQLERFINRELANQHFIDMFVPELTTQNTICQGRTLIFSDGQKVLYFKLQRLSEDKSELIKEYLMHSYLNDENKIAEFGLKSEVPRPVHLCKLPWQAIPVDLQHSLEGVRLYNGTRYYTLAYCYETSSFNYANYAWQPTPDSPEAPCTKAEMGMLLAIHDLGRWCAKGFLHTSTLPAFHVRSEDRRWLALNALFRGSAEAMCGRLDFLNDESTERPDYRHSGLADLVDYERFGQLDSYFSHDHDSPLLHFPKVGQNICLANFIVEVLTANVLLYGRLYRDQPDYHIDKEEANARLCEFISQLMQQFLLGLLRIEHPRLEEWLCTTAPDFQAWQQRSVQEILYWTTTSTDTRNFATDYQRDHRFDPDLYPCAPGHIDGTQDKQYPTEFSNNEAQPTLGVENGTFPFMSLVQGLTKFASVIIRTLSQGETDKTVT